MTRANETDRPTQKYEMPEGITVDEETVRDLDFVVNTEYKCFPTNQYETVANIVIDYRWFWVYTLKRDLIIRNYELKIEAMNSQIIMWKTISDRQGESSAFVSDLLTEDRALKAKGELRSKIGTYIAVGVAIAEMFIIGALAFK